MLRAKFFWSNRDEIRARAELLSENVTKGCWFAKDNSFVSQTSRNHGVVQPRRLMCAILFRPVHHVFSLSVHRPVNVPGQKTGYTPIDARFYRDVPNTSMPCRAR